jgi:hypothetical protein
MNRHNLKGGQHGFNNLDYIGSGCRGDRKIDHARKGSGWFHYHDHPGYRRRFRRRIYRVQDRVGSVTGFDIRSLVIAVGGAVLLLIIYRVVKK